MKHGPSLGGYRVDGRWGRRSGFALVMGLDYHVQPRAPSLKCETKRAEADDIRQTSCSGRNGSRDSLLYKFGVDFSTPLSNTRNTCASA